MVEEDASVYLKHYKTIEQQLSEMEIAIYSKEFRAMIVKVIQDLRKDGGTVEAIQENTLNLEELKEQKSRSEKYSNQNEKHTRKYQWQSN